MKPVSKFLIVAGSVLMSSALFAAEVQTNPIVIHAQQAVTPLAFRDMKPLPFRPMLRKEHERVAPMHVSKVPDPLTQTVILPQVSATIGLNFDGITGSQGGGFVPPDTNASVGDTQVVETVNIAYSVYNKTTGLLTMGPTNIQTLYSPLGGECGTGNLSDPVVNYDKIAARWTITMIAFNNTFTVNNACVAVSTTSDATGTYHLYSFSYGKTLPDYPKLAVWPDAYFLTTNSFPSGRSFSGAESCALDRTNMLAGNPATAICFQRGTSDFALLPSDLDGATLPPTGSPNYEIDESATSTTQLNLYKFHVDFVVPTNSTFTGPTTLKVAAYTDACAATGTCITQPSPGEKLDSLGGHIMHRFAYRNFGDHEALVANHSIKPSGTGGAVSGVRWYEIRSPGAASPVVFQSGTVGGGTGTVAKWMGSIAMDKVGDIALGYSKSNTTTKPTIEFVGRVPTDAKGTMESAKNIKTGTGVQTGAGGRWGDYSSMAIDPTDDCTFWYAQEYYSVNGFNWHTRMASFKFTGCL